MRDAVELKSRDRPRRCREGRGQSRTGRGGTSGRGPAPGPPTALGGASCCAPATPVHRSLCAPADQPDALVTTQSGKGNAPSGEGTKQGDLSQGGVW